MPTFGRLMSPIQMPPVRGHASRDQPLYQVNQNPRMRTDLLLAPPTFVAATTSNSVMSKYLNQGWTDTSLSVSAPWISLASGVHLLEPRTIQDRTVYGCYFTAFTRGVVDLDVAQLRAVVADDFKDAVSAALSAETREEAQSALRGVFNRTGHVLRTRFWLGASTACHSTREYQTRGGLPYAEPDTRDHLLNDLEYEASQWANGYRRPNPHVKIIGDSDQSHVFNYKTIVGHKFRLGGTLPLTWGTDFESWLKSTERYRGWAIIKVEKVVPVIELLDPVLCQQVINTFAPLVGRWVRPSVAKSPWKTLDLSAYPGWYWLSQKTTKKRGTDSSTTKVLIVRDRTGRALATAPKHVAMARTRSVSILVPRRQETSRGYVVLGAFLTDSSSNRPDLSRLRAIRRDLLVQGDIGSAIASSRNTNLQRVLPSNDHYISGISSTVVDTVHVILQGDIAAGYSQEPLLLSKYAIAMEN
ncbi:hypothetical protein BU15DRAFT_62201 [Melanogaster broomeanus]|nr:hypothetical protein BU15DRAFT_62201 [Melanogaster broomeanus]